jgi:hypothetical protein
MDIENIREGMTVYSEDGHKLGKIIRRDDEDLIIEKGVLSRTELAASLDDVARVEGDRVWLRQTAAEVEGPPPEEDEGFGAGPGGQRNQGARDADELSGASPQEVVVVFEEEIVLDLPTDEQPGAARGPGGSPKDRR